jgi:hypothetical protein
VDQLTHSMGCLEFLVSFGRKRQIEIDGPGAAEIVFLTKFVLERLLSTSDDDQDTVIQSRESNSTEDAVKEVAKGWLKTCVETHQRCNHTGLAVQSLPTRLIDVRDKGSDVVFLLESSSIPESSPYATLSHCWGTSKFLELTGKTRDSLKSGIIITDLPKTFQDAIAVTRKLDIKYLWIDSLCILQDSLKDWIAESSNMGAAYSSAVCNIAATASSNSHGGLFRSRDVRHIEPIVLNVKWQGLPRGSYNLYYQRFWERDFASAPLLQRGWVLQERLLARRVLHFNRQQLFWECEELSACETYPNGVPKSMTLFDNTLNFKSMDPVVDGEKLRELNNWDCSSSQLNPMYVWENVIRTYTACSLTKADDKLVAISGIAKWMHEVMMSQPKAGELTSSAKNDSSLRYLAGLWSSNLPAQLIWSITNGTRSPGYRAPSWSWASLDGLVSFSAAFGDGSDLIDVISVACEPLSPVDPYGQVSESGSILKVRGRLAAVTASPIDNYSSNNSQPFGMIITASGLHLSAIYRPDYQDISQEPHNDVHKQFKQLYCMPIRRYQQTVLVGGLEPTVQKLGCLVLESVRDNLQGRGCFRRVGVVTLEQDGMERKVFDGDSSSKLLTRDDYEEHDLESGFYTICII